MSLITDCEADLIKAAFSRRAFLGAGVAGGVLMTPLAAMAESAGDNAPGAAEITVDRARSEPIPIVIPSLGPGIGSQISGVVSNDLNGCGLFKVIGSQGASSEVPDFAMYKGMGARALVTGSASGSGSSTRVEFRLWDVLAGQQLQGTAYTASSGNWRRIAHIIADVIYERLLGEKGYFDTRIAYVALSGPRGRLVRRLAIMDQDGANARHLTNGKWIVMSPRFSPVQDQIAFMSYANDRPRVYLFDLASGRQSMLGEFSGISFAPRFSPDGRTLLLSATRGSGSDIYAVDVGSGAKRQLTGSGAIDTSPCYSPDGSQIVFNSDRGGSPQLYVMSASGGGVRRLSYGHGSYGSPVWSPTGDRIAFTRISGGQFSLGVMAPDGTGERILTQGYTVESPTFCPNGRVLAFARQSGGGGASRIGVIDVTGFNERLISMVDSASGPSWSPLNK